jgi:perosamine synthetase
MQETKMISLATADVNLSTWMNVADCLIRKRLGRGKYVERLEKRFSEYIGVKHAIATCNGTMADTVMLMTLKQIKGGEEVVLPAFSFVAQANSVLLAGLKPVFCDVNEDMSINSNLLAKITETNHLCTFPAHMLGKDCSFKFNGSPIVHTPFVEDSCEAMGGDTSWGCNSEKRKLGTLGIAGSFSMFPSHTITTGEGGMIVTNSDEFSEIARSIINHGKWQTEDFSFKFHGVNAKMSDLQAAVGCSLVGNIDYVNSRRRENVELYNEFLGLSFYATAPHCYPVFYDSMRDRDMALQILRSKGIQCRKLMGCIPDYPFFKKYIGHEFAEKQDFPVARKLADTGLYVPVHQNLYGSDIERICEVIYETRQ